jgi:phenylacetate-CoA ligase
MPASKKRKFWDEKVECLSVEDLEKLQLRKLKKQIRYVYDHSSFYKKKLDDCGVGPRDIRTLEDFRALPICLTKEELQSARDKSLRDHGHPFGSMLCAPIENVVGVAATSGTTGVPTFYGYTRNDIHVTNEVIARSFWRIGVRPGEPVVHAMGMSMWVGGLPIIRGLEHLGARVSPVGAEAGTERLLTFIGYTKPTTLLCTPSYAEHLIERAPGLIGKDVGQLGIKRLVCIGEPGVGIPEVRKKLTEAWDAKVFDGGGGAWGSFIMSCDSPDYHGMHVIAGDHIYYCDIIDPKTKKPIELTDGAIGEKIMTPLDWEAAPPFRYASGDLLQVFTEPCACGVSGYRVKIIGRVDDLLIVKGINVFPSAIKDVVNSFFPRLTGVFKIVLDTPPPRVVPPLKLKVEYGDGITDSDFAALRMELEEKISDILRFRPATELVPPTSLGRTKGKASLFERNYLSAHLPRQ